MAQDKRTRQREGTPHYDKASGGWGSSRGIEPIFLSQELTSGVIRTLKEAWRHVVLSPIRWCYCAPKSSLLRHRPHARRTAKKSDMEERTCLASS